MKTIHWVLDNHSGMHRVAESMVQGELALGVDARMLNPFDEKETGWDQALDADVHINHTHIPGHFQGKSFPKQCAKPYRWVFPIHGTPEHVFESTVQDAVTNGYNSGTSLAHHITGMQTADAIVTFWSRHQFLYQRSVDKHTPVHLVPMGIDTAFWGAAKSPGKYAGRPSFITNENAHPFKWCVEILKIWSTVREDLDQAILHCLNIPSGVQRFVDVLATRYNATKGAIIGNWSYGHAELRHIHASCDFYLSPVRYGDHNRCCLEASAAGCKVISYPGNPYAHYWMQEGDHRYMARDLVAIGKGDVAPMAALPVPTLADMAQAMVGVYEDVLNRPRTIWALGEVLPDAIPDVVREAMASATWGEGPKPATPVPTVDPVPSPLAEDAGAAVVGTIAATNGKPMKKSSRLRVGRRVAR